MINKIQSTIYNLLCEKDNLGKKALLVQSLLAFLILASSVLSMWETVPENSIDDHKLLKASHYLFGIVFVIEYILRLWVAPIGNTNISPLKARIKAFKKPAMLIDLLVIIPFMLPAIVDIDITSLRVLRLMRIMSIIRFGKFSNSIQFVGKILKKSAPELLVTLTFSLALLIISATGIYHLEKDIQPEHFRSIPQSLWWAVNALTGIWLGDVYPITVLGKAFATFISFVGVGTVALPAGILANGIMDGVTESKNANSVNLCPHCNNNINKTNAA